MTSGLDFGKRTVFKRLGDEISQPSVTSTTPFEEEDQLLSSNTKSRETISRETVTKAMQDKVSDYSYELNN